MSRVSGARTRSQLGNQYVAVHLPEILAETYDLQVTDAVHVKGSFIFLQLWALGRAANYAQLQSEAPSFPYVSASDVPLTGRSGPLRALTMTEIKEYVELYAQAAKNAVEAGFDGVEVHGTLRNRSPLHIV